MPRNLANDLTEVLRTRRTPPLSTLFACGCHTGGCTPPGTMRAVQSAVHEVLAAMPSRDLTQLVSMVSPNRGSFDPERVKRGDIVGLVGDDTYNYLVLEADDKRGPMPRVLVQAMGTKFSIPPQERVERRFLKAPKEFLEGPQLASMRWEGPSGPRDNRGQRLETALERDIANLRKMLSLSEVNRKILARNIAELRRRVDETRSDYRARGGEWAQIANDPRNQVS